MSQRFDEASRAILYRSVGEKYGGCNGAQRCDDLSFSGLMNQIDSNVENGSPRAAFAPKS